MVSFPESYEVSLWVSFYGISFEVHFVRCNHCFPCCSSLPVYMAYLFSSLSISVCVGILFWGGSLVGSICVGHVFFSVRLPYVFWPEHLIHLHLRLLLIGSYSLPLYSLCTFVPFSLMFFVCLLKAVPLSYLAMLVSILFAFFWSGKLLILPPIFIEDLTG